MTEALHGVANTIGGLDFSIVGMQDNLKPFKDFGDTLNDDLRDKLSVMKKMVDMRGATEIPGMQANNRYNSDGFVVDEASKLLEQAGGKDQILMVLSDGQPEPSLRVPRYQALDKKEELKAVIRDCAAKPRQRVLGIGLGKDTEFVGDYYDESIPDVESMPGIETKDLVDKLGKKIGELIKGV